MAAGVGPGVSNSRVATGDGQDGGSDDHDEVSDDLVKIILMKHYSKFCINNFILISSYLG